jgi:hypothetical protein
MVRCRERVPNESIDDDAIARAECPQILMTSSLFSPIHCPARWLSRRHTRAQPLAL